MTVTTTPASRVLPIIYEKTLFNKGVADLSTVKYYNYTSLVITLLAIYSYVLRELA
jgi:hypothetical protein